MLTKITHALKKTLKDKGIENFQGGDFSNISVDTILEPPCSIKWMSIENYLKLGAFSYAVSGYYSHVAIGRYSSIGEQVQIGRSNHAMTWMSTSPFFYVKQRIFDVGEDFQQVEDYRTYVPKSPVGAPATSPKRVIIGNDVWIGHGAFIRPGVTVGDGAIIGAYSVVTKDVPPYGVVAGNPAQLKKMRLPPHLIAGFLEVQWWRFAPWQLKEVEFWDPDRALDQLRKFVGSATPYAPELVSIKDLVRT